ncbi:transporter (formate/nitrite transporter family protein) [Sphingomonas sp. Leaf17]|uniref:formate/nitrite transporter family protein n=1 Tax=Sphingomonas sp. Leaf17 TaxID=1735683 RepID=UPI0006F2A9B5|nr:formate/nitrite transporter family protein [Sphingomonas sp. Leaf17]KQM65191.1 transporter (formate/nitrite transporter family protein) [Sphingomonas sp. Leaf17]
MTDQQAEAESEARERDIDLDTEDRDSVAEHMGITATIVHEVVRRQGDEELDRPASSLWWSGVAGGVAVSASILGHAMMEHALPDAPWRPLVASIGYSLGFLIVIMGRMQLFTETTLSAVIPVATHPTVSNATRMLRLWGIVFLANVTGTFLVAAVANAGLFGVEGQHDAMLELSRKLLKRDALDSLQAAIPAGFLIAAIPWTAPAARGQEFWLILILTYFVALGGFGHVVAGSGEMWLLVLSGEATIGWGLGTFLLPTLAGNIIGGTVLFAVLAHAQVAEEL